jgi:hypothetical protein
LTNEFKERRAIVPGDALGLHASAHARVPRSRWTDERLVFGDRCGEALPASIHELDCLDSSQRVNGNQDGVGIGKPAASQEVRAVPYWNAKGSALIKWFRQRNLPEWRYVNRSEDRGP